MLEMVVLDGSRNSFQSNFLLSFTVLFTFLRTFRHDIKVVQVVDSLVMHIAEGEGLCDYSGLLLTHLILLVF